MATSPNNEDPGALHCPAESSNVPVVMPDCPSVRIPQILKQEINVRVERNYGVHFHHEWSSGSLTFGGCCSSSVNAFHVFSVLAETPLRGPGGRLTIRPCAQDPQCSRPLVWMVSCLPRRLHLAVVLVMERSFQQSHHSPALNMDTLSCNLALGTNPSRGESGQLRISFTLSCHSMRDPSYHLGPYFAEMLRCHGLNQWFDLTLESAWSMCLATSARRSSPLDLECLNTCQLSCEICRSCCSERPSASCCREFRRFNPSSNVFLLFGELG